MNNFTLENNTNNRHSSELNFENKEKSREFGKDITNAFIGARKSLDQAIMSKNQGNTKLNKYQDFKPIAFENKLQKKMHPSQNSFNNNTTLNLTQSTSLGSSRFNGAPKQTYFNKSNKKPLKKQASIVTNNHINKNNDLESQNAMEIDSIPIEEEFSSQVSFGNKENIPINTNNSFIPNLTANSQQNKFALLQNNVLVNNNSFNNRFNNLILASNTNNNYDTFCTEAPSRVIVQEVPEYVYSIFLYLKEIEETCDYLYPRQGYMKANQYDINEKMRAILLDWLTEVHLKFKLLPETLFLTINIIDRFLNLKTIHRSKLQLVGVTAMFIACKYEEIYAPEVKDFVFITDKAYTNKDVLEMEKEILLALSFNVTVPSAFRFYEMFNHFIKYDNLVQNFILFLLDLCALDYKMLKYKVSQIAAACVFVASKLLHKERICVNDTLDLDIEKLYELSGYKEGEIKECAKEVCMLYDFLEKTNLHAIRKKYSLSKFREVAKLKFGGKN